MKKTYYIFIDIIIVLAILMIIDYVVGRIGDKMVSNLHNASYYGEINDVINTITPDVLIIGASTAKSDIDPAIIMDSVPGITVYNAGSDGKNILYHSCAANAVIERKPPRMIICVVHPSEFDNVDIHRVSVLNPFYDHDSLIASTVNLKSSLERIKIKSNLYRYNSSLLTIFYNRFESSDRENGYRPLPVTNETIVRTHFNYSTYTANADLNSVQRFKWFLDLCNNKHIPLWIICSPSYSIIDKGNTSLPKIGQMCRENDIDFTDYSQNQFFINHPNLFRDEDHLNYIGAKFFTQKLITDLENSGVVDNVLTHIN